MDESDRVTWAFGGLAVLMASVWLGYRLGVHQPPAANLVHAPASMAPQSTLIGSGTRILSIGDSHLVGAYGTELDRLLRTTGASVETVGSAGSSPSWWLDGHATTAGFAALHADGTTERPPWQVSHATPKLAGLLPTDMLIASLGANLRGSSPDAVKKAVQSLVAVTNGTKIVWVGPPNTRATAASPTSDVAFYDALRDAVTPHGTFVDSRVFTPTYASTDASGIHYTGAEGTKIAKAWANGVFEAIR